MRDFHLVYDGDCGFCVKVIRLFSTLDVRRRLVLHDGRRRSSVLAEFPELRDADLDDAMFSIDREGIARGFFAFRRLIRQSPLTWVLVPLFYAPGASWAGPRLYHWVAGRRHTLGCRGACPVPPQR